MEGALEIPQVVREAAGADDEESPLRQRCQREAEAEGVGRVAVWQRKRDDGHVGVRIHQAQRHPGAVVEAALAVEPHPRGRPPRAAATTSAPSRQPLAG